jgi:hypothetical protein
MPLLIGGIVALVFGIITVVTGKLKLGDTRIVVGAPARIAGVILIMSFPLALLVGVLAALLFVVQAPGPAPTTRLPMWLDFVPLGALVLFVAIAFIVGCACSQPPEQVRPRLDRDRLKRAEGAPEEVRSVQSSDDRIQEQRRCFRDW